MEFQARRSNSMGCRIYSFLDYGDRFDGFKTGPEGLFNQGAAAAVAVADGGLFEAGFFS